MNKNQLMPLLEELLSPSSPLLIGVHEENGQKVLDALRENISLFADVVLEELQIKEKLDITSYEAKRKDTSSIFIDKSTEN
ncbi:MAG: hypothetical protein GXO02_05620 [Epsilonproteobacteria bacterium]|nr:hypothetical protein [Campylobacterota bacterium]